MIVVTSKKKKSNHQYETSVSFMRSPTILIKALLQSIDDQNSLLQSMDEPCGCAVVGNQQLFR